MTPQKQSHEADTARRQNEPCYRSMFECNPLPMWVYDLETFQFLAVNKAAQISYGFSEAEFLAMTIRDIRPSADVTALEQLVPRIPPGPAYSGEWRHLKKDGTMIQVAIHSHDIDFAGRHARLVQAEDITQRKQVEASLRESQRALATLLGNLPGMAYRCRNDRFWTMEFVSEGCLELTGYSQEDLQFNHRIAYADLIVPEDQEQVWQQVQAALAERKRFQLVYRIKTAHAAGKWVWEQGLGIFAPDGTLTALEGFIIDITERKVAEEAVRKSESSLALAQRVAHLGSWEEDLVLQTLQWSEETYRIFGQSPTSFIPTKKTFFNLVHPEDRERVWAAAQNTIATGQAYAIDHRILLPDGSERVVSECADIFFDAHGQPARMVGTVQDITRLKQVEQALQRSEKYFRSLIENVQDLITIVDIHGMIRFQSPSIQRVLGYSPDQFVNHNVFEFMHEVDAPVVKAALSRALLEPEHPAAVEYRLRHVNGSWRTLESIGKHLHGDLPLSIVVNSRDITDRRRLEEQFRQSQKMEAIGQLAGGVAHDFNNILTIIQGNATLLLETATLTNEDASMIRQIVEATERAAGLTRQLLLFSRHQKMQPDNLDLNDIVANMTKLLQRILGEDIVLRSEYSPNPLLVRGDAGMIEQILLNLVVNARDAMPDGGHLTMATSAEIISQDYARLQPQALPGKFGCLSVRDSGCGIAPENLPRIFEPFFTTKAVGKGSGLGLATVYGIVTQHGGWIEVASELNQGTTFRIFLPAAEGSPGLRQTGPGQMDMPQGQEAILVVEDEPALRLLVNNLLQRCGYTVLLASSGVAALAVWQDHKDKIQLLLTDLIMPDGMTGIELARKLCGENPRLKVIYTSGYSADLAGQGPVLHEGVNFLQKPYSPYKLAQTIRDCLHPK